MALTVTAPFQNTRGIRRSAEVDVTFDASYLTGGEAFDANAVSGFTVVDKVVCDPSGGYIFEYKPTTKLIQARWVDTTVDGAVLSDVASTTNMSTITTHVTITGY